MNKPERTLDDVLSLAVVALAIAVAVQIAASSCAKPKAATINVSGGVTSGVVTGTKP